jgi:catechol 2,3-dioxygenase-like lactoylglutathione lyase family enzyme
MPRESPPFAILRRDGLRLQLGRRENGARAAIEWGPEVYAYHRREFAFRDPDGHVVILSEVTDDPPTCRED